MALAATLQPIYQVRVESVIALVMNHPIHTVLIRGWDKFGKTSASEEDFPLN